MKTTLLSEVEYKATFRSPMKDITGVEQANVVDIWPYVQSILKPDLEGHEIFEEFVEKVYRSADGQFDHVLVMTKTPNVYLAVIVDVAQNGIHGHRLLDLTKE